ncbi:flagellar hook-associated protein FlgK [Poseidonocella sedimentorum]|uniref:Flagellar hook-associated protein 1 n=1 Tax=Poseidonocella sedimentorum TaxID=871652 RepID=A0A1I6D5M0_9RHOB|nr:flagellar hook-associated protein FlgK [Poseidonocella sedimentorum]SFR00776.1 flagellar hook-associated protein 1 FlgK [Poseidonocella sedimentorum]
MSISASLQNALTGLTASSKAAQLVSSNMANVMTEGYATREIELSSAAGAGSGGVRVDGITRSVDPVILADRRGADAELTEASTLSDYMTRLERAFGIPDDADSLNSRINDLETALISASSRPDSEPRLRQLLDSAVNLTDTLNGLSDGIQSMRLEAEKAIESAVGQLNTKLEAVHELNRDITQATVAGRSTAALEDARQVTLDAINELVPIRLMQRDNGAVAVLSAGGQVLVDSTAKSYEFTPVNAIEADMAVSDGSLDRISIDGEELTASQMSQLSGGKLSALFTVRDDMMVDAQSKVDAVARDLIDRFQDSAVDTSLLAGDPGLFTDNGALFDAADEVGIAQRISVNDAANPDEGGELWRLRDGMSALTQGNGGNSAILQAGAMVLTEQRSPSSTGVSDLSRTSSALASDVLSYFGVARQNVEADLSYAASKHTELTLLQMEGGVDTDQETQKLLLIEQSYQANARVMAVIDEMMDTILRI